MNVLRNNRRKVTNSFRVKPVPGSRSVQRSEEGGRAGKKASEHLYKYHSPPTSHLTYFHKTVSRVKMTNVKVAEHSLVS